MRTSRSTMTAMTKRLGFAVAIVSLVASCDLTESGYISATWSVTLGGQNSNCQTVGADAVRITSVPLDGGLTKVDLYDCDNFSGTTSGLRPGAYSVSAAILDVNGSELQRVDAPTTFSVFSGEVTPVGNFNFSFTPASPGKLSLTWMITRNGFRTSCNDVNGDTLQLSAVPVAGGTAFVDLFDCDDEGGTSSNIPVGDYHVQIRLFDSAKHELNLLTPTAVFTVASGVTRNVGNFVFDF